MKREKLLKRWCEVVGIVAEAILEGCSREEYEDIADHVYELLVATRSALGFRLAEDPIDDATDE